MREMLPLDQRWSRRRVARAARRVVATATAAVTVGALVWAPSARAAAPAAAPAAVDETTPGRDVKPVVPAMRDGTRGRDYRPAPPVWPAPGASTVAFPGRAAGDSGRARDAGWARAGAVLVSARTDVDARAMAGASPSKVRVEMLDPTRTGVSRAVRPVLLRVGRADGLTGAAALTVGVEYGRFAQAYGADWGTRLRLVRLPECALSTPDAAACRPVRLASRNDAASRTVTAAVSAPTGGVLLALLAESAGPAGSFSATTLTPSATWSAGGNSGDFSWSYPMRVPPAAAGPMPDLTLAYSSQSVDGRHAATNNQPSWIGEGFEFTPGGFIERKYVPCSKDMTIAGHNNTVETDDLCWKRNNASLSMAGHAGELIFNSAEGRWHLRSDDGSKVELLTGATNGDDNGEHWKLTTTDGTQYFFGRGGASGWAPGRPETNSVLSVPVFGNHANEPCNATTFAASSCSQAWRWSLDYVVDPHGNTMSLWYTRETNRYGRNNSTSDAVEYHRAGYLDRIDYGTNNRSGTDTQYVAGGVIPGRVEFGVSDRCLSSCTTNSNWPDTPLDRQCTGAPCNIHTPTFWTKTRLTQVKTRVWNAAVTPAAFKDVETWTLTQSFPAPGDGTRAGLWLQRIGHTGLVGGSATVPDVVFGGTNMNNRVNPGLYGPGMAWWRVQTIRSETGGQITVDYSGADCTAASLPSAAHTNTRRCFPSIWEPPGFGQVTDWFHRYVVTQITETDLTTGVSPHYPSPAVLYRYDYPEPNDPDTSFRQGAAWHYTDDDGLVDDDTKTWSVWRGYDRVRVTTGNTGDDPTFTETRYLRGMHGDKLPSGTRVVEVGNTQDATTVLDEDWWAGQMREQIVYNGPGGAEVSGVVNIPWASEPTATRTVDNVTVHARFTAVETSMERTALAGGAYRRSQTTASFDAYGQVVQVEDSGDLAATGDERCARTAYAYDTTAWLLSYPKLERGFALACLGVADPVPASVTSDDVAGETRISYDNQAWGTPPTKGDATRHERAKTWAAGVATAFVTHRTAYDALGRQVDVWDPLNRRTTTAYTPASGGPLTRTVTTNPASHTATVDIEPAFGLVIGATDPNGKRTDASRDPLGRLTEVYLPGRVKGTNSPSMRYTYTMTAGAPVAIRTEALNPDAATYTTSHTIYDGLMRHRQVQTPQPTTGRIVNETFYDSVGRPYKRYGPLLDNASPSGTLFAVTGGDSTVNGQINITEFDGVSRPTAQITKGPSTTELWHSTFAYTGDRVHTTPPAGGVATTAITDVRGHTVALRQYKDPVEVGSTDPADYDVTTYAYSRKGQLTHRTDSVGNQWISEYDLLGRKTRDVDPDKGTTTSVYDDAGQLVSTVDGRGVTLSYAHDNLGRQTSLWAGAIGTGAKRAEWTYDTVTNGKGYIATSTRYNADGHPYTMSIGGYSNFYQPTSVTITIPAAEQGLAGSYETRFAYTPTGAPLNMRYPSLGIGGGMLAEETVTYTFRPGQLGGLPNELRTTWPSLRNYVTSTTYTSFGEVANTTYDTDTVSSVQISQSYEQFTRRLSQTRVLRQVSPGVVADLNYDYDEAGNITEINDTAAGDRQCFDYDYQRRLTEAWTPSGDCEAAPSVAALGGPAPYWTTWTINTIGNRTQQVRHAIGGDTTTTYSYPTAGAVRPHAVTGTSTTGGSTGSYEYDDAGNTSSRPTVGAGQQELDWDEEGHLAATTDSSGTTTYLYDTGGGRLIRTDATGKTLYLPGQELRYTAATNAKAATRYYAHNGAICAVRTSAGFNWVAADRQGSVNLTINPANQAVSQRRQDPYGNPRGTASGTWPAGLDKGFVGGTLDPTGLIHIGAREYDPLLGRFVSVDPIIDNADPQQWNGYSYANNSPVTFSDPDGQRPFIGEDDTPSQDPKIYRDPAEDGFIFVEDQYGRKYRIGDNNKGVDENTQVVLDDLTQTEGANNKQIAGDFENVPPADGDMWLATDETYISKEEKEAGNKKNRRADLLKLTFQGGKLVKVTRVDVYAPTTTKVRNIRDYVAQKIEGDQADEVIILLRSGDWMFAVRILDETRDINGARTVKYYDYHGVLTDMRAEGLRGSPYTDRRSGPPASIERGVPPDDKGYTVGDCRDMVAAIGSAGDCQGAPMQGGGYAPPVPERVPVRVPIICLPWCFA
jgi:RHS repeat-associated protein